MKLQSALGKASLKRPLQTLRLLLAFAMAEDIVGVTLKGYSRMVLGHPPIERIVQKEIR
jgi:hypothetical protein